MASSLLLETALTLTPIADDWLPLLRPAIATLDSDYCAHLLNNRDWLPGIAHIFRAFTLPRSQMQYILWGESPYPRIQSANGFAFWDAAVGSIWSDTGFSKPVNRATSLRNLLKMLLIIQGLLKNDLSQAAIATIDRSGLVETIDTLFQNFLNQGFLLLNASLVLSALNKNKEAKYWQPFINQLLIELKKRHQNISLILFGNIAKTILSMPGAKEFPYLQTEHPYVLSFIRNPAVQNFFRPFHLLQTMTHK